MRPGKLGDPEESHRMVWLQIANWAVIWAIPKLVASLANVTLCLKESCPLFLCFSGGHTFEMAE